MTPITTIIGITLLVASIILLLGDVLKKPDRPKASFDDRKRHQYPPKY